MKSAKQKVLAYLSKQDGYNTLTPNKMTYEELNQDLSDLQRAKATVEFMNLFRQMLNEARFFSHDERSLRGYLIEDIEKKKLKAEEFLKTCR